MSSNERKEYTPTSELKWFRPILETDKLNPFILGAEFSLAPILQVARASLPRGCIGFTSGCVKSQAPGYRWLLSHPIAPNFSFQVICRLVLDTKSWRRAVDRGCFWSTTESASFTEFSRMEVLSDFLQVLLQLVNTLAPYTHIANQVLNTTYF